MHSNKDFLIRFSERSNELLRSETTYRVKFVDVSGVNLLKAFTHFQHVHIVRFDQFVKFQHSVTGPPVQSSLVGGLKRFVHFLLRLLPSGGRPSSRWLNSRRGRPCRRPCLF